MRAPSTPRIESTSRHQAAASGLHREVNLHAVDWMASRRFEAAPRLVLTFDYGYEANELYAPGVATDADVLLPAQPEQRSVRAHRRSRT
jgi:SAM-dependent MidA family methyltransferase